MCNPTLQLKVKKAAMIFASDENDEEEEKEKNPRDKLKVMNYITGQQAFNDARYVAQAAP